jgi:hypothetical protein
MANCIPQFFRLSDVNLSNWISVGLTMVIAGTTIVYAWLTRKLWIETKRSADAATTAANAAKQSADALTLIERPWLLAAEAGTLDDWSLTRQNKRIFFGYVKLKNYGKSPAWLTGLGGSFDILKSTADLPSTPIYREHEVLQDRGVVLVPLGTEDTWRTLKLPQPEDQLVPVPIGQNQEHVLCFYGYIKYKDIFGRIHETRFCYQAIDPFRAAPLDAGPNYTFQT